MLLEAMSFEGHEHSDNDWLDAHHHRLSPRTDYPLPLPILTIHSTVRDTWTFTNQFRTLPKLSYLTPTSLCCQDHKEY